MFVNKMKNAPKKNTSDAFARKKAAAASSASIGLVFEQ